MDLAQLVQTISIYALPVIFGITLHEAAHGYVAKHFGDMTAYVLGRVSLNPVRHIDPIGTILVPLVILLVTSWGAGQGMLFGWAKPVPVNYHALRKPKRHMMWVAAAGPGANLAMALGWALLAKIALVLPNNYFTDPLFLISQAGVTVNLVLMLLNLIPLLPLDGGRIVAGLLPARMADQYARLEPWGFPILLALMFTNVLGIVLGADGGRLDAADRERVQDALEMFPERVVSGMRPTGSLHLGHYHGALKNWVRLQSEYPCYFFVADWHALTTHYEEPEVVEQNVWDMVIDWLASGVDPAQATLFIQSRVPEHAELHTLLSMITPLGWLERVPTYKDQQEKLADRDLSTYGFLGYPLLQSADVLIYRAKFVPVGEDQVPHVEFMREIARRFNHIYGREPGFEEKALAAAKKLGSRKAKLYRELRTKFQEQGDATALEAAKALLDEAQNLSVADRERLFGYLEGGGRMILVEPDVLLTEASRLPGLDGAKMSKSYGNTIGLRESAEEITPEDPHHADRPGAGEAVRSRRSRQVPGVAVPPGVLGRQDEGLGAEGLSQRGDRLPGVQATGDRRGARRAGADARAGAALPRRPDARPEHRGRRLRQGARARA